MKAKHIIIATWFTLALSILPEVLVVLRFAWLANQHPLSNWHARVIQHRAAFIPLTQWFTMVTLFLGWQTWHRFRTESKKALLLAAGLPLLLCLLVNLYEIQTWYHVARYDLGTQERIDPTTFLKPLQGNPNNK